MEQQSTKLSAALEAAYDEHADAIFRHCYFRTFNRELGKDLLQETFLKVWEYMQKGQQIDNMRAFLYRIANNLIIDHVRKHKEMSLEALQEAGFDPTGENENSVTANLEEQRILSVIGELSPENKELIIMRFIDGLKPQEIGELLGLAPNTVSVKIHRALKDLKSLLRP